MRAERTALLADQAATGSAWCRAHAALVDDWLVELFAKAAPSGDAGLALVAVGGYGRGELAPGSDVDVLLLHEAHPEVAAVAEALWYPIWEQGMRLGHSVATPKQTLALAADDLDTATTLLSARHVAGDPALTARLAAAARSAWERRSRHWLSELAHRVGLRHRQVGEVAYRLEPDLKEGRGGLRDVHALRWAEAAHQLVLEYDAEHLAASETVLLDARVELQRRTGQASNVLALQEQDDVARALGDPDADSLMARIAEAARSIAWTGDDAWRRIESAFRTAGGDRRGLLRRRRLEVSPGILLAADEVALDGSAPLQDPLVVLRVASAAAAAGVAIERRSLERLAREAAALPEPWPPEARGLLVELLGCGAPATLVIEALDQRGLWTRLLPEWAAVRALPPHSAYHRFTVDRHLLEAAANASRLAGRVDRPDLLVVAALLHDLGKVGPHRAGTDHSRSGAAIARTVMARMGFPTGDVETVAALVELHLVLAQAATRRDLDDPATAAQVAAAVGTVERLGLLAALTEADSLATGPAAWGPWKSGLVQRLVEAVTDLLEGCGAAARAFPSPAQLELLAAGGRHLTGAGGVLTVVDDDRPGMFSRVAGVLAVHGLDVLAASAHSSDDGRAVEEFHVAPAAGGPPRWSNVLSDLERALDGSLAIGARVTHRARTYARSGPRSRRPEVAVVSFDNHASATATVIDVRAPDRIGTLYRITRTLAEFDLDIRTARVQTLGAEVVDAFYVRNISRSGRGTAGTKILDPDRLAEIERAILHALEEV